jgi:hypothetical protein
MKPYASVHNKQETEMGNFCCFCFKTQPKVEVVADSPYTEIGEGPHWDAKRQSLYYVDILGGKIFRLDYKEKKVIYGLKLKQLDNFN